MTDWVNKGSYQDLTHVCLKDPITAMAPTSQAGGNMLAQEGNDNAMTAPGSPPVDVLNDHVSQVHEDPTITPSNSVPIKPATDGKPQARGENWSKPGEPAWTATTKPSVVREK